MSCLETISKLREQQQKTVQLYQDLYDSFISTPSKSRYDLDISNMTRYNPDISNMGKFNMSTQNNTTVNDLITEQSLDSTCDIPRNESQNTTISEMWRNFSVDKYAPRSENMRKLAQSAPPVKKSKPRRPKITVPDPFYMTLRDELKKPVKTKAQEEAELRKMQQELEEEAECRKQFKASPIPTTTYGSRLSALSHKQETRRSEIKEQRKILTKAMQKPFSFDRRENNLRRSKSLTALDSELKKVKETPKFHARPMPYHIFDPEVDEKAREEEAYRKIRMKMRAEQLLTESDLPSSMKRHALHYTDGHIRRKVQKEKEKYAHMTEEHTFTPAIKDYIPHYSLLQNQQEEELLQRQSQKTTTICEPFNLQTEKLAQIRALNRSPSPPPVKCTSPVFRKSPCLYTAVYPEHKAAKHTISSSLRDSATRQKLLTEKKKLQTQYETELVTKMKEVELRKDITEKSKALDPSARKKQEIQIKLRRKIEEQRVKELEYKAQLDKMKEKLKERPFLFERASTDIARQSADKTFRKVLIEAGVDPSLVEDLSKFEEDSLMVS